MVVRFDVKFETAADRAAVSPVFTRAAIDMTAERHDTLAGYSSTMERTSNGRNLTVQNNTSKRRQRQRTTEVFSSQKYHHENGRRRLHLIKSTILRENNLKKDNNMAMLHSSNAVHTGHGSCCSH